MERDCFKIFLCILPTGINPTSIISLSRPECWKNYSLFNFKPLETGTFSLFTLFANLKLVKITKSAKGQYLWANAIVSAICDTHEWVCDDYDSLKPAFVSSFQNHCFHGKKPHFLWHLIQNCVYAHKGTTTIKSLGNRSYTASYKKIRNLFSIIEKL